jgi:hypothetical protein
MPTGHLPDPNDDMRVIFASDVMTSVYTIKLASSNSKSWDFMTSRMTLRLWSMSQGWTSEG